MAYKRSDISDLSICRAVRESKQSLRSVRDIVSEQHPDVPEKVVYAAMQRTLAKGLIDYGVTLESAWLTAKGKDYLQTSEGH